MDGPQWFADTRSWVRHVQRSMLVVWSNKGVVVVSHRHFNQDSFTAVVR